MKTPEQWLEEWSKQGVYFKYNQPMIRLIQAIQNDAVDSTHQAWKETITPWVAQMRAVLANPGAKQP